jgi:adenylosuccinate lyase
LYLDRQNLARLLERHKGKGFKGAVGTSASYAELLGVENLSRFEARVSEKLDLPFFTVTTQVYPRKQDYDILSVLAGLGASLYKFAFDLRLLQSPSVGEMSEPFGEKQIGSSAMPFKRNPIRSEKIDSLARLLAQFPRVAWDNAAHTLLERTLDDSANRRTSLPEAFLAADEILRVAKEILQGLRINEGAIQRNLEVYVPFAATERVLMALGKAGANRDEMHHRLRQHALNAWDAVQNGQPNPLFEIVVSDPRFLNYLPAETLRSLIDASEYVGDAPQRALTLARQIRSSMEDNKETK